METIDKNYRDLMDRADATLKRYDTIDNFLALGLAALVGSLLWVAFSYLF